MASSAIDLTVDDDDGVQRQAKRPKLDGVSFTNGNTRAAATWGHPVPPPYHARPGQWQPPPQQQFQQHQQQQPGWGGQRGFVGGPPPQQQPNPFSSPFVGPSRSSSFGMPSKSTPSSSPSTPAPIPAPKRAPSMTNDTIPPMPALPQAAQAAQPRSQPPIPPMPQIIDLTASPSPPPAAITLQGTLDPQLPAKTPICIGLLTITALVLYPISYLSNAPYQNAAGQVKVPEELAPVRLRIDPNEKSRTGTEQETIHILTPSANGIPGENFGVMEQKAASALAPFLSKGLIRMDAKVRRGGNNMQMIPLQLLVFTPKGNIPHVAQYLMKNGLLLEHPSPPYDPARHPGTYYHNPHNPPPGGFARAIHSSRSHLQARWSQPQTTISAKTLDGTRSQVDEVFNSLRSGDDLEETEPGPNIATSLYPHQKKALSFLLEREGECKGPDGKSSSLWVTRHGQYGQMTWYNIVTQREVNQKPRECKGALLADDMGVGKTIQCISLVSATLSSARQFASIPAAPVTPAKTPEEPVNLSNFSGSVWDMPEMSHPSAPTYKGKGKSKAQEHSDNVEAARAARIRTKSRGTLIICPLSTISNWEEQFREHWAGEVTVVGGGGGGAGTTTTSFDGRIRQGAPIRLYIYHGTARRPEPSYIADFDVVVTTYSTLASEFSKQQKSAMADDDDETSDGAEYDEYGIPLPRKKAKAGTKRKKAPAVFNPNEATSPLQMIHWFRVVLDEAHSIKETSTVASRATCDLMADRRLCLTGTPVQNKLDDLFALIKFLRLDPFDDKTVWTEFIGGPVKFGQSLGVARLQTIMKAVTLRRTKETKDKNGKNILDLPPRRDEMFLLKFSEHEQAVYNSFFDESQAEFAQMSRDGEVMKNYVGILQKILRLRQICDDVELVRGKGLEDPAANYDEVVAAISREGINVTRACVVFTLLREMGTAQCVECGVDLATPTENNDAGLTDELEGPKKSRKKAGPNGSQGGSSSSRGPTRQNSPSGNLRPVLTRCQHLFCLECFQNCVCSNWPRVPADLQRQCSACSSGLRPTDAVEIPPESVEGNLVSAKKTNAPPAKRERRQKGSLENFKPSTKVKALIQDLMPFSKANPHSNNFDPESIEVQMVDDKGNAVDDGITKSVVFSQWTSMLDKIEEALESAGIHYDRLDGTMKRDERSRAMDNLKHDPRCEVLLVSLRAGGVGLNLTAARRVYLVDPYWNPAVENQAVDRIHRLGQTRPVMAIKLIIENSIEEKLLEVQRRKTELAKMTLGQTLSKAQLQQRRLEELNELLG